MAFPGPHQSHRARPPAKRARGPVAGQKTKAKEGGGLSLSLGHTPRLLNTVGPPGRRKKGPRRPTGHLRHSCRVSRHKVGKLKRLTPTGWKSPPFLGSTLRSKTEAPAGRQAVSAGRRPGAKARSRRLNQFQGRGSKQNRRGSCAGGKVLMADQRLLAVGRRGVLVEIGGGEAWHPQVSRKAKGP